MYRGTLNELAGKLSINGRVLGYAELSAMTRFGAGVFCKQVGTIKTSAGKGKPAGIWEFKNNPRFNIVAVSVVATGAVVTPDSTETVESVASGEVAVGEVDSEPVAATVDAADAMELT